MSDVDPKHWAAVNCCFILNDMRLKDLADPNNGDRVADYIATDCKGYWTMAVIFSAGKIEFIF